MCGWGGAWAGVIHTGHPSPLCHMQGLHCSCPILKFLRQDLKPHREYTHQLDANRLPESALRHARDNHPSPYAITFGPLSSTTRPFCQSFLCVESNLSTHAAEKLRAWHPCPLKRTTTQHALPPDLTVALRLHSGHCWSPRGCPSRRHHRGDRA